MRRSQAERRTLTPDPRFRSLLVTAFINRIMRNGKKNLAENIVYSAFDSVEEESGRRGIDIFEQAVRNITPVIEVKPRRVGGATYQVPVDIRSERRQALALRWLVDAARSRGGRSMLGEASCGADGRFEQRRRGGGVARRIVHRMAEANRAFVHYRW